MKKIITGTSIGIFAALAISAAALAVGSNGSFELGDYDNNGSGFETLLSASTDITDWTVDTGEVDWIGNLWPASQGEMSLDLNGFNPGSISQDLITVIGATYNVTFDMSGNPDSCLESQPDEYCSPSIKLLTVSATGGVPQQYSYDTDAENNSYDDMKWQSKMYSFVATSTNTTLAFTSDIEGAFGPALDNVQITETLNNFTVPAECDQNIVYNHIVGKNKAENINGTSGNDLIEGMGGADRIDGKGGNDCIVGGSGADNLTGGAGDDVLLGMGGADNLNGNAGMDKLYGADGADNMHGGADDDYLNGGANADRAFGDGQTDTCIAEVKTSCEL